MPDPAFLTHIRNRRIGWVILLLACALFGLRGTLNEERVGDSRDFKPLYGAAACFLAPCNLYDNVAAEHQYLQRNGDYDDMMSFDPHYLGYPPTALVYIVPFTYAPWPAAKALWLALLLAATTLGVLAMGDLCLPHSPLSAPLHLAFLLCSNFFLISFAQPTALVIGLCLIGTWCLLRRRFQLAGVVALAFSLVFKPHLGFLVLLYFLLAERSYGRRAFQVIAVTVCLALPGLFWAAAQPQNRHWPHDLSSNLHAAAAPGELSDLGPSNLEANSFADLQSLVSLFRNDPHFYNPVTWALWLPLFVLWLYAVRRLRPGPERDYLCLAAASALALLPTYHRFYDTRILLLTFPAFAWLFSRHPRLRLPLSATAIAVTCLTAGPWLAILPRHVALGTLLAALATLASCYYALHHQKNPSLASPIP